jgi:hypothetical protein
MKNYIIQIFGMMLIAGCTAKSSNQLILFDPAKSNIAQVKSFSNDKITMSGEKLQINFLSDKNYTTIAISPADGVWDASDYRFVRCEIENLNVKPQICELGFGNYDLTQGATIVPPYSKRILKAIIYRTEHPAYIDSLFPVMHGKPDGCLRGWMATTYDSIEFIKLLFPEIRQGDSVRIGKIWFEEPYTLLSREELKEKYYPFVDKFGQYMYDDWPDKIYSIVDLKKYDKKEKQELEKTLHHTGWNKYGGLEDGPQLKTNGRFRIEKYKGKWWFVDPEGRLFWSHGLDCVEFGTQSQTRITDREQLFSYLPAEGSPEEQIYTFRKDLIDSSKWLSFHALNLFRKYSESWKEISMDRIHDRMRSWGINTIGNWSDPNIYLKRKTPYVLTAYSRKTGVIADPYAAGFQENLEESLSSKKEEINDPWCVGVFVDNELKWGVKWASKIPEQIQQASSDQPAKRVFIDMMKDKYKSIESLNRTWKTSFISWEGLLENKEVIPGAAKDMRDFMKDFTSEYYSKCRAAVKNVSPEMLYMGCRMDFHLYPEDTSLNYIIKIASEYCDVVSFNRYRYTCAELIPPYGKDYPIIIGEFHFGSLETGLLQPGLRYAADQNERAEFYEHYVSSAIKNPYIVGTHWFQLVDQAVTGRRDGENYQAGFLTVGDVPQEEIISKSRMLGYNMYKIRSK